MIRSTIARLLTIAAALGLAGSVAAQSVYPTAAGQGVKVSGVVPLQCNSGGTACAPVTASNPAPVSIASGGTGTSAQQVQGAVADGAAISTIKPVIAGGVDGSNNAQSLLTNIYGAPQASGYSGAGADGISNVLVYMTDQNGGINPLYTASAVFNGASFDRQRGEANGTVVQPALSATFWNYAAVTGGIVSSTADVAVKAAGGASVRNYVCTIDVTHDLLSAASEIVIKDGASTVIWRGKLQTPATDVGGGAGKILFNPCLRGTANTAVNVAMISSVTGGVYVNASGYTGS